MSLMGTLGKVAMGVMIAKGVGKMMSSGGSGSSGGGLGGLLGGLTGGGSGSAGGLGGLLGGLTGQSSAGGSSGGLGGLLNSLGGNPGTATPYGSNANNAQPAPTPNFGDLFNTAFQGEEPEVTNTDEENAKLMIRAMISSAKADGELDADEQQKLTEHLADASPEEIEFVRQQLQEPSDIQGIIRDVPAGMEKQVYLMSLLGITLDSKEEAIYLDKLARGLNISQEESNRIHEQLGAPKLYN